MLLTERILHLFHLLGVPAILLGYLCVFQHLAHFLQQLTRRLGLPVLRQSLQLIHHLAQLLVTTGVLRCFGRLPILLGLGSQHFQIFIRRIAQFFHQVGDFFLFGLLLEDVTQARRPMPGPAPAPVAVGGGRDAYATGYTEQAGLYTDDYAQAQYGGGEGSYQAGTGESLLEEEYAEPAMPVEPEPAAPPTTPMCPSCGKPTEWIEEYNRHYCYDCDAYV